MNKKQELVKLKAFVNTSSYLQVLDLLEVMLFKYQLLEKSKRAYYLTKKALNEKRREINKLEFLITALINYLRQV